MLLSRVAERLYWAARYLERAEGTARIVREHSNVIVDLPLTIPPNWEHLLGITGGREGFDERYETSRRGLDRVVPGRRSVATPAASTRASVMPGRTCERAATSFRHRLGTQSTTCTLLLVVEQPTACSDAIDRGSSRR